MSWPKPPWPHNWSKDDWSKGSWSKPSWTGGWTKQGLQARLAVSPDRAAQQGAESHQTVGLGWHPDTPDRRDRTLRVSAKVPLVAGALPSWAAALPRNSDNRRYCSPIEDQEALGSCTAQAVVGAMEYMLRRSGNGEFDGSRLFVYKISRKLLGWTGDTGAYLRTAMKTVGAFGVPPEQYWPYDINHFEDEPDAFLFAFAGNYKSLEYTRIDAADLSWDQILVDVKRVVAGGLPVVFGFSTYSSISQAADIPFPAPNDTMVGGHAVMIAGYDDDRMTADGRREPSLLIRNSWGIGWGEQGYGYLPYRYVTEGLTQDFWTVLKWDWLNEKGQDSSAKASAAKGSRGGRKYAAKNTARKKR